MSTKPIIVADMFCGAGGTSTGLLQAAESLGKRVELVAVNHWETAIETHAKNHPAANHFCASLDSLNPRKAVPGGRLDLLWASPECTHHSRARGGKPMNDQSRATAWCVLRWAEALEIDTIMIENVPEFQEWGPTYPADHADEKLRCRPIPQRKGKLFELFVYNLKKLGYTVEWRELVCANYGDATTRKRFFLQAKKGRRRLRWPEQTHMPPQLADSLDLGMNLPTWRPASEIIDWNLLGKSIYGRKRPLKENTLRRIYAGLEKFGGLQFVLGQQSGSAPRGVNDPLPTVSAAGAISLTQPCLVVLRNNCDGASIHRPMPAICTSAAHFGLAQPVMVQLTHGGRELSVDSPLPTITTANRGEIGIAQPYLVEYHGGRDSDRRTRSVDDSLPTLDTSNRFGLAQPFLMGAGGTTGQQNPQSLEEPLGTVLANDRRALIHPYLVSYYGNGGATSVDDPLDTVTARDRFALCEPSMMREGDTYLLDILFRMLQPHELAAAHSFPEGYQFAGNRDDVVRQIGNSVPVRTARALGASAMRWQA